MLSYSSVTLDNGLQVMTIEQPHLHSASVSLYVRCGSRYERIDQWGLSHLVEHMLFRGSRRFPDSRKLAQVFERSGGTLEASTWRDHTSLTTSLHPSRLRAVLTALADMIKNPLFQELDLERAIVGEELQSDLDEDGEDADLQNMSRASIWRGHALGRRIAGCAETLEAFTVDDVIAHHASHYVGANMVLCCAGRVERAQVEAIAHEVFGDMPRGLRTAEGVAPGFPMGARRMIHPVAGSQLTVQLSFESLAYGHRDFAALELLTRVLDDGISSRLHQAVCERKGLVYELTTGLDCYADCGLYDIELKVAPRRAASAIEATLEALQTLCVDGITDDELEQAKEQTTHELEFRLDSSEDLAEQYGCGALFGHADTLEIEAERLASVTADDVVRAAMRMFASERVHATLVGPVQRANMTRIDHIIDDFVIHTGSSDASAYAHDATQAKHIDAIC